MSQFDTVVNSDPPRGDVYNIIVDSCLEPKFKCASIVISLSNHNWNFIVVCAQKYVF